MPKPSAFVLSAALFLSLSLVCHRSAQAKSSRKVSYSYERIWPTAVRFLRIDEGLKILEKDADTGYVLFELKDEGKRFTGSLELVRRVDESRRDAVEIILRLNDRPSYMEIGILNHLLEKIHTELGTPKEPPANKPADKPAQGGDTPAEDGNKPGEGTQKSSAS